MEHKLIKKIQYFILFLFLLPTYVFAIPDAGGGAASPSEETSGDSLLGKFGWDSSGPIEDPSGVAYIITRAMNVVLLLGGIAFFGMILWGGITIGTAAGNQERLDKGKKILTAAVIGLLIVVLSRLVVGYFINMLGGTIEP